VKERLLHVLDRYDHLTSELSNPDVINDSNRFRELSQERARIDKLIEYAREYLSLSDQLEQAQEMLAAGGDMAELAFDEAKEIKERLPQLEKLITIELLPKDPYEGRNVYLEIRAGAGGDEASLFAADLFRMYSRWALKKGWSVEVMSESHSDRGGYKEVVASITGADSYRWLKFESGVHRVQRVPTTEASGRIHTSTVTVAIMAEAEETEINILDKDLRIDTFRSGGAGGQHVNKTDSAVRITHIPTNTVVVCQEEKSQIKNRAKAMRVLRSRILETQREAERVKSAADRKSQVGTGERNERIRTYNFPQERITDHRINLTLKKLSAVMEGDMDEIVEALQQDEYTRLLAEGGLNAAELS
jgi:peptide chain release factor 1